MSDGMSDSRALGSMSAEVETAAYDLGKALKAAAGGHRGWKIRELETANEVLRSFGYQVTLLPGTAS